MIFRCVSAVAKQSREDMIARRDRDASRRTRRRVPDFADVDVKFGHLPKLIQGGAIRGSLLIDRCAVSLGPGSETTEDWFGYGLAWSYRIAVILRLRDIGDPTLEYPAVIGYRPEIGADEASSQSAVNHGWYGRHVLWHKLSVLVTQSGITTVASIGT